MAARVSSGNWPMSSARPSRVHVQLTWLRIGADCYCARAAAAEGAAHGAERLTGSVTADSGRQHGHASKSTGKTYAARGVVAVLQRHDGA